MDFSKRQADPRRHLVGITLVIAFHAFIVYALVTGLAKKVVDLVRAPIETKVIEEVTNRIGHLEGFVAGLRSDFAHLDENTAAMSVRLDGVDPTVVSPAAISPVAKNGCHGFRLSNISDMVSRADIVFAKGRFAASAAMCRKTCVSRRKAIASLGDPQKYGQATLNFHHRICINAPKGLPYLVALHGHGLVKHDL